MGSRAPLSYVHNVAQSSSARATVREFDDKHLVRQIKFADALHGETPSDFESPQPVGLTTHPLKQFKDKKQDQQKQQQQETDKNDGDWNHNQPKGKSSEVLPMHYVGGSRSHPVAGTIDDRRVRPYNSKEGDTMLYHASGTEQKVYVSDTGVFVLANNNKSEEEDAKEKDRYASVRHVDLEKQKHEIKKGEEVKDHKHEGDKVNTEIRCTKNRIEFRVADKVVGYYDKDADHWQFNSKTHTREATENVKDTAPKIDHN